MPECSSACGRPPRLGTHSNAHAHMAIWRILTSLPSQRSRSGPRRPSPGLSNQSTPNTLPPQGDWIRGLCGTAMLLGPADNWVINVKPLASESESTELQARDPAGLVKLLSHLDNGELTRRGPVQAAEVFTGPFCCVHTKHKSPFNPPPKKDDVQIKWPHFIFPYKSSTNFLTCKNINVPHSG